MEPRAQMFREAFARQAVLADSMERGYRYNAACNAALAGCGKGKSDPPTDRATRVAWREKAREWLKSELLAWNSRLKRGPTQGNGQIATALARWKIDKDLAGIRDEDELKQLPAAEQATCRALWAEADALLMVAARVPAPLTTRTNP